MFEVVSCPDNGATALSGILFSNGVQCEAGHGSYLLTADLEEPTALEYNSSLKDVWFNMAS